MNDLVEARISPEPQRVEIAGAGKTAFRFIGLAQAELASGAAKGKLSEFGIELLRGLVCGERLGVAAFAFSLAASSKLFFPRLQLNRAQVEAVGGGKRWTVLKIHRDGGQDDSRPGTLSEVDNCGQICGKVIIHSR